MFIVWQQHRLRLRRVLGALAALCLSLACAGTPAWAGTGYVDGISDQGLMSWTGNLSGASGPSAGFPAFFARSWVGGAPSHIKLARYVVQWDVMQGVGYPEELANLQRWYDHVVELQLIPELALDNYNCSGCSAPRASAEYTTALEALHRSFPDIQVLEAWNEPNNSHYTSYLPPAAAAHLMNAAYAFCELHSCTAIAGDLLDSEPNMLEYERYYEQDLTPADPGNWGIHPYHAVKYMTDSTVTSFRDALPNPTTDRIWFTEVGAYYCEAGKIYGERSQAEQAQFLVDKLIPEFQPAHVFYYELAWGYDEPPACDSEQDDSALYAANSPNGALSPRAAARVIFDSMPARTESASTSPAIQATQATRANYFACEPALDERWQRGECPSLRELFAG